MPIEVGGQVVWVDCADEDQATKDDKNNLVLDFDTPNNAPAGSGGAAANPNQNNAPLMNANAGGAKRAAREFSEDEKQKIINECIDDLYSPTVLSEKYNVNVTAIRGWIKNSGRPLPQKYKFLSSKTSTKPPTPSSAQAMSPSLDPNAPK